MNTDLSQQQSKPFKICYKNEIHRVSKIPPNYKALIDTVTLAFKNNLPNNWRLQYEDADGDLIMLINDEDYQAMLECESESPRTSFRVVLKSLEDIVPSDLSSSRINLCDISRAESTAFSVIQTDKPQEKESQDEKSQQSAEVISEIQKEAQKENLPNTSEETNSILKQLETKKSELVPESVNFVQFESESKIDPLTNEIKEEKMKSKQEKGNMGKGFRRVFGKPAPRMQERRREKMREVMNELMVESIPTLADMLKEYIASPNVSTLDKLKVESKNHSVISNPPSSQAVHNRVTCDGCGVFPITGIRYKCAICHDFDYCERCEASIEHPHAFVKIKDPKQAPRAIIAVIDEEVSRCESSESLSMSLLAKLRHLSQSAQQQLSGAISSISKKLFEEQPLSQPQPQVVPEPVIPEKIIPEEVLIEEIIPEKPQPQAERKEECPIGISFAGEMCTIPSKITVHDKAIYKTISVKNSGIFEWPRNAVLKNVEGVAGQETKLVQLAPGKRFSCILILEGQKVPGKYTSTWRLAYHDEKGVLQYAGEEIMVEMEVIEPELRQSQVIKMKEEAPKKVYAKEVEDLAKQVREIFPEVDLKNVLDFVEKNPKITLEELAERYLTI